MSHSSLLLKLSCVAAAALVLSSSPAQAAAEVHTPRQCWGIGPGYAGGDIVHFGVRGGVVWYPHRGYRPPPAQVRPSTAPSGDRPGAGGTSGGSGGDGDIPKIEDETVLLIAAVAVVAALPVVVYALDDEAPEEVTYRWGCPTVRVDMRGGMVDLNDDRGLLPLAGAQGRWVYGPVGVEGQVEGSPLSPDYYRANAAMLLVPPPKAHIEGALSLGVEYIELLGEGGARFALSLPHRYLFVPERRNLGLSVRPTLLYGTDGLNGRLEAALLVPIVDQVGVEIGGQAFSVASGVSGAASIGLTLGY